MSRNQKHTAIQAESAGHAQFNPRYHVRPPQYVLSDPELLAAYRAGYLRAAAEDFDRCTEQLQWAMGS